MCPLQYPSQVSIQTAITGTPYPDITRDISASASSPVHGKRLPLSLNSCSQFSLPQAPSVLPHYTLFLNSLFSSPVCGCLFFPMSPTYCDCHCHCCLPPHPTGAKNQPVSGGVLPLPGSIDFPSKGSVLLGAHVQNVSFFCLPCLYPLPSSLLSPLPLPSRQPGLGSSFLRSYRLS